MLDNQIVSKLRTCSITLEIIVLFYRYRNRSHDLAEIITMALACLGYLSEVARDLRNVTREVCEVAR